jgi:endonuclease/exonuclease/phosphatase family metal-dependent hydrolase
VRSESHETRPPPVKAFIDLLGGIAGVPPTKTVVMGDFNNVPKMEPHFLLEKFGIAMPLSCKEARQLGMSAKGQ